MRWPEPLAGFEEENRHLAQVEVNEVLRLMRYVATEVPAHDAVPGGVVFLTETYLLDVCCNILLYIVLLHGLRSTIDSILLHVLRHVSIFDHSLSVRHDGPVGPWPLRWLQHLACHVIAMCDLPSLLQTMSMGK
uniref:Dynein light chain n=1 Tax=Naja naja TaxID=35670 RepID=A0A8C6YE79_NAJNA